MFELFIKRIESMIQSALWNPFAMYLTTLDGTELELFFNVAKNSEKAIDLITKQLELFVERSTSSLVPNSHLGEKEVISSLMRFVCQLTNMVNKHMENCFHAQKSLMESLEKLVNIHAFNIPVSFSQFCLLGDGLLDINPDVEQLSSQMDLLFSLIREKDIFLRLYEQQLALRLLQDHRYSSELIHFFFEKVKRRYGSNSVSKIRGMMADSNSVKHLSEEFQTFMAEKYADTPRPTFECNFYVLNCQYWPQPRSGDAPTLECFETLREKFSEFYQNTTSMRRLKWINQFETVVLKGILDEESKKPYEFSLSLPQAAILLLFNDDEQLTLLKVQERASFSSALVEQCIKIFLQYQPPILIKSPAHGYNAEDLISANSSFHSDIRQHTLPLPNFSGNAHTPAPTKVDKDHFVKHRRYKLQSRMARLLKHSKIMTKSDLFSMVRADQVMGFVPEVKELEACLEELIDQEYIERKSNQTLHYIP
eukprot:TRINITY_DN37201_c0_g1_i4.p1 TRINITY_DN37201_c0_g1~~TRINITY_DN37201_c0_g1_i4.p1  ORF type:complete len:480 (-),score=126.56 TRINITY_DN37201_c0_g1_i4:117-1556(-)